MKKYYYCPKCGGKFRIPPDATEIVHICHGNQRYTIPVSEIK